MTPSELQAVLDRRTDRAALAASTSRRNTPTALLFLSLTLLVVAILAVVWSWTAREAAVGQINARVAQAQSIHNTAAKIKAIDKRLKDVRDGRANAPIADVPLRLQEACLSPTLKTVIAARPTRKLAGPNESGNVLNRYPYDNLQHDSIADIMAWIESARKSIPALEIDRLSLKPSGNTWTFSVTFTRWEKKES